MKNIITILAFLCFANTIQAQEKKAVLFSPTVGITWRSTVMNYFNFDLVQTDPFLMTNYERNAQGLSLNLGIQAVLNDRIGFEYFPNFRYDHIGHKLGSLVGNNFYDAIEIKAFIVDHNFNFFIKRKKIMYGLGFSIINTGKTTNYGIISGAISSSPVEEFTLKSIEFKTYNVFVSFPIKKVINFEIKALYIPKGLPHNPNEKYIMYSLRAYYKFNFLNKKKKK